MLDERALGRGSESDAQRIISLETELDAVGGRLQAAEARGDGFVLSSLHSRQQTRVFLKQISSGKAETTLSEEEAEAIRRAAVA